MDVIQVKPNPIPPDQTAPQRVSILVVAGGLPAEFCRVSEKEVTLTPPIVILDLVLALVGFMIEF